MLTRLIRAQCALLLTVVVSVAAIVDGCAQTLPPTNPTALPAANTLAAPIAATPTTEPPHHAQVTYTDGMLNIRADNSSLNQILRIIATLTKMKITGGVAEERVFGDYGPATPPVILATLLDGTGSNMLYREAVAGGPPSELILTPRGGGPTPPSPDSSIYADTQSPVLLPQRIYNAGQQSVASGQSQATSSQTTNSQTAASSSNGPVPAQNNGPVAAQNVGPVTGSSSGPVPGTPQTVQPLNNVNGSPSNTDPTAINYPTTNSVPISTLPTPSTTPSQSGIVDAPNPPPPGSTTSPNPGNVATPEQVYQQLKALQQQRQQNSQTGTASP